MTLTPIGVIRTPYLSKYDAPRQPGADDRIHDGTIDLFPGHNFEQALTDLDGFSHIWVISWFDQATGWKPMVLPPRSRRKHGVFATRSPHRPNPIGISVVQLLSIHGLKLQVRGADLLDGTPVLDIKPYLPYADAIVDAGRGWTETADVQRPFEVVWACLCPDQTLQQHIERVLRADPFPHPYRRIKRDGGDGYVLAVREHRITYTVEGQQVVVVGITP